MDKNDFLGSFAQENVKFTTEIIRTTSVGDNFFKTMIFVENDRFVDATTDDWVAVPGSTTAKALTVTADTYATFTTGLLKSWLYDLFASNNPYDCILVAVADKADALADVSTAIQAAYEIMKPYAYHKTVLCGADDTCEATIAVAFAELCAGDKGLLSSAPYFPVITDDLTADTLYTALTASTATAADAMMAYHPDVSRNGALFTLGLALAVTNGSGTPVGNGFDMVASGNITPSSADGTNPSSAVKTKMSNANIQYFKTVGDNTGNVAALGAETIKGDVTAATWVIAYITYMVKVRVAELLTTRNFWRNSANYDRIVSVLATYLKLFESGGRLTGVLITVPGFNQLPSGAADEIIIPNAWEAHYVDVVRNVKITGSLYIGA